MESMKHLKKLFVLQQHIWLFYKVLASLFYDNIISYQNNCLIIKISVLTYKLHNCANLINGQKSLVKATKSKMEYLFTKATNFKEDYKKEIKLIKSELFYSSNIVHNQNSNYREG